MKKLICIALAAAMPFIVTASEKTNDCAEVAKLAGHIAEAHQNGVTLDAILGLDGFDVLHPMIIEIYSMNTRYSSEAMQNKQVVDTKNSAMLACMKAD